MAYTEAGKRATIKYVKENYDRIEIKVEKGQREILKAHADKHDGGSVNAFIKRAIAEQIKRDNKEE